MWTIIQKVVTPNWGEVPGHYNEPLVTIVGRSESQSYWNYIPIVIIFIAENINSFEVPYLADCSATLRKAMEDSQRCDIDDLWIQEQY